MEFHESLTTDRRIGNGVVVIDDKVEAGLEEIVVEPLVHEGLHFLDLL